MSLATKVPNRKFNVISLVILTILAMGALGNVAAETQTHGNSSNAFATSASAMTSNTGTFLGQNYSGVMEGGALYLNNSFPFQDFASNSRILALPAVSSWLTGNDLTPSSLRPFVTMYPSQGNPYDFTQTTVTQNGTTYYVYEFLVAGSTDGQVIGVWVSSDSAISHDVAKIFTYETSGPDIAKLTSETSLNGAGQEVYDTQLTGTDSMYGATNLSAQ